MKNISEAELEVMQVLWQKGASTSLEIISEVKKKKEWKNNTIMTLVTRLVNKEFIDVIREDKSLLIYKPKVSEYDYKSKETNNFIDKLYNGSINNMLVAFAKSKKLSKQDLEDLIKLVGDEEDK
ncbi:MAG: BlaI/MecI/CopY family transcriptional regulator [Clostridia bacterium]|nr:BlaI/MecI/CopY family transcriptional regulator [Clostridia bacterium]